MSKYLGLWWRHNRCAPGLLALHCLLVHRLSDSNRQEQLPCQRCFSHASLRQEVAALCHEAREKLYIFRNFPEAA